MSKYIYRAQYTAQEENVHTGGGTTTSIPTFYGNSFIVADSYSEAEKKLTDMCQKCGIGEVSIQQMEVFSFAMTSKEECKDSFIL